MDVLPVVAAVHWLPVFIWQMTVSEMMAWGVAGQTVCFNVVLDVDGQPIKTDELRGLGLVLRYGWDGGDEEQHAPFEKAWPEPPGNFAMGNSGRYWVEIESPSAPSARVYGITLHNPADSVDPHGHHATVIVWQRHAGAVINPQLNRPANGYATIKLAAIDEMLASIDTQINALRAMRQEVASWRR